MTSNDGVDAATASMDTPLYVPHTLDLFSLEAVEKPEKEEPGLRNDAHCATFLPTHTNTVGGERNKHPTILSNGFNGGAMDTAPGIAPGAEMAPGGSRASAVRSAAGAQGDLVSAQDRLSVAHGAARVRQMEYRLCLFQVLARDGGVGQADGDATPA